MVNSVSLGNPSLPLVDDATARRASDAPARESPSINFVTTTSRTDRSTSWNSSHASSSRSTSLSQLARDEGAVTHLTTSTARAPAHRTGSAPPDRMRKSALTRVMNMEGLESHIHVDPMRSDSLHHFDSATSGASSSQGADSDSTDGDGARSTLVDTVQVQPRANAPRSSHSKFKTFLGRAPHFSLDPRQQHDSPSLYPSENSPSKGVGDDKPRRPDMPRSTSEPSTRGRHGRAKSVSALFVIVSPQQNEMPPLPKWSRRPDAPSEGMPSPSASVLSPAAKPPSSWIRQRLRPSSSSLSLGTSRKKQPGLSNSVHSNRHVTLPSTPSSTSVHTVQSSAPSLSSTAQSWQSKSDFGFIKALGSFVAGRRQSKVDDYISDEELLRWRRPGVERDRATFDLGASERVSSSSELGSSGRDVWGSARTSSLSKISSGTQNEDDVLVIERSGRSGVKSTSMGSTTRASTTRSLFEPNVPLQSNLSINHVHPATHRLHSGAEQKSMRSATKTSYPPFSSPLLIENRPLRSPRSSPCLPHPTATGMEAASQLAASILLYNPSSSKPSPLPIGLAPRPAAGPRKKPPTSRMSEPPVGESRRIISNEAWEQVSLSARNKQSTRLASGSSAAFRPLVASSSSRTSANEDSA